MPCCSLFCHPVCMCYDIPTFCHHLVCICHHFFISVFLLQYSHFLCLLHSVLFFRIITVKVNILFVHHVLLNLKILLISYTVPFTYMVYCSLYLYDNCNDTEFMQFYKQLMAVYDLMSYTTLKNMSLGFHIVEKHCCESILVTYFKTESMTDITKVLV